MIGKDLSWDYKKKIKKNPLNVGIPSSNSDGFRKLESFISKAPEKSPEEKRKEKLSQKAFSLAVQQWREMNQD